MYITGATGFVGHHVVEQALRRGHDVTAVIRPDNTLEMGEGPESGRRGSVREARIDLRSSKGLPESLDGADVVIHLAAAKSGDFYTQFAGTVVATENLLAAMEDAGITNLVGVSTFSVYDYLHIKPGTLLDERSPIDTTPNLRDEYARTKLIQEKLYRRFGADGGNRLVIIRPGMIYGPDNLWHALLGADIGTRFLRIGSRAVLPLCYVENCAEALVLAAEKLVDVTSAGAAADLDGKVTDLDGKVTDLDGKVTDLDGKVINLVDDDLPTQQFYAELVSSRMETPPSIRVPWAAVRAAAGLLKKGNQVALAGRAKFPGIAVPDRLHARFKPLRYTNRRAKELLGWTPRYNLQTAVDRSIAEQELRAGAGRESEAVAISGRGG